MLYEVITLKGYYLAHPLERDFQVPGDIHLGYLSVNHQFFYCFCPFFHGIC